MVGPWVSDVEFDLLAAYQFLGGLEFRNVTHHSRRFLYAISSDVQLLLEREVAGVVYR